MNSSGLECFAPDSALAAPLFSLLVACEVICFCAIVVCIARYRTLWLESLATHTLLRTFLYLMALATASGSLTWLFLYLSRQEASEFSNYKVAYLFAKPLSIASYALGKSCIVLRLHAIHDSSIESSNMHFSKRLQLHCAVVLIVALCFASLVSCWISAVYTLKIGRQCTSEVGCSASSDLKVLTQCFGAQEVAQALLLGCLMLAFVWIGALLHSPLKHLNNPLMNSLVQAGAIEPEISMKGLKSVKSLQRKVTWTMLAVLLSFMPRFVADSIVGSGYVFFSFDPSCAPCDPCQSHGYALSRKIELSVAPLVMVVLISEPLACLVTLWGMLPEASLLQKRNKNGTMTLFPSPAKSSRNASSM
jgi:hypothetical protein